MSLFSNFQSSVANTTITPDIIFEIYEPPKSCSKVYRKNSPSGRNICQVQNSGQESQIISPVNAGHLNMQTDPATITEGSTKANPIVIDDSIVAAGSSSRHSEQGDQHASESTSGGLVDSDLGWHDIKDEDDEEQEIFPPAGRRKTRKRYRIALSDDEADDLGEQNSSSDGERPHKALKTPECSETTESPIIEPSDRLIADVSSLTSLTNEDGGATSGTSADEPVGMITSAVTKPSEAPRITDMDSFSTQPADYWAYMRENGDVENSLSSTSSRDRQALGEIVRNTTNQELGNLPIIVNGYYNSVPHCDIQPSLKRGIGPKRMRCSKLRKKTLSVGISGKRIQHRWKIDGIKRIRASNGQIRYEVEWGNTCEPPENVSLQARYGYLSEALKRKFANKPQGRELKRIVDEMESEIRTWSSLR